MKKPFKVRTKIEAVVAFCIVLSLLAVSGVFAVQRFGTDPSTGYSYGLDMTYISTSKDNRLFDFDEDGFHAALNYLNSSGEQPGTVYLPEGTLTVTRQTNLMNKTSIVGKGIDVTVISCSGIPEPCFYICGLYTGAVFKKMIHLSDFTIQGDNSSQTGNHAIKIRNASYNLVFERLRFRQMGDYAVSIDGAGYLTSFVDCVFTTNKGGVRIQGLHGEGSNGNQFTNCYFGSTFGAYTVLITSGSQDNIFADCQFENNKPTNGLIRLADADQNTFISCVSVDNTIPDGNACVYVAASSTRNQFIGGQYMHDKASDGATSNMVFYISNTADWNLFSNIHIVGNSVLGVRENVPGYNNTVTNMMRTGGGLRLAGEFNRYVHTSINSANMTGSATASRGYMWYDSTNHRIYVCEGSGVWKYFDCDN